MRFATFSPHAASSYISGQRQLIYQYSDAVKNPRSTAAKGPQTGDDRHRGRPKRASQVLTLTTNVPRHPASRSPAWPWVGLINSSRTDDGVAAHTERPASRRATAGPSPSPDRLRRAVERHHLLSV